MPIPSGENTGTHSHIRLACGHYSKGDQCGECGEGRCLDSYKVLTGFDFERQEESDEYRRTKYRRDQRNPQRGTEVGFYLVWWMIRAVSPLTVTTERPVR